MQKPSPGSSSGEAAGGRRADADARHVMAVGLGPAARVWRCRQRGAPEDRSLSVAFIGLFVEFTLRHTITSVLMAQPRLVDLLDPATTALVTQECQGGVIGPQAGLPMLAEEARREAIPNIAKLLTSARAAQAAVVHCLIQRRPDGRGSNTNARLFASAKSFSADLTPGSPGASVLPEFGPEPTDLVLTRLHGAGPMTGTELDSVLRNLGIKTIVGVGVSVNVAITNFAMDAVNRGYQFVLPRDAVSGFPREYAEAVIDNTLALLTTVTTTDAVVEAWASLTS
ncbi:peroxyureidoacrylate/ureidoacrylate amidohydrolase RutB [Mycobacterium heckeshornense]|nr:peroxyureidoacrylate/ureidoacrylate amidohydrolase RutB [Mycobacterium heckeshornense]